MTAEKKRYYLYLLIATITAILLAGKIDYSLPQYSGIDLFKYKQMALSAPGINLEIPHPYVYRIFIPWLAGMLPFGIDVSFYILNLLALSGLSFIVFEFILFFGVNYKPAFFATVAFLFNRYFYQFLAFDYFQASDTFSYFLFILSFLMLSKKKYFSFAIIATLGILTREIALLIIPVGFAYLLEKNAPRKDYISFTAVSFLIIFIFIAVRLAIQIETDDNYLTQIQYGINNFFNPVAFVKRFVVAFTPFSVIPFLFWNELIEFFKKNLFLLVWAIFAVISSLFGNDYERLMSPTAPVFYLFLAIIIEKYFWGGAFSSIKKVLLFSIVIISLLGSLYHLWGVVRLIDSETSLIFTILLDVLVLLIFGYLKFSARIKNDLVKS